MAYTFPIIEFKVNDDLYYLLTEKYGLPPWWKMAIFRTNVIIAINYSKFGISNYALTDWIQKMVSPIIPKDKIGMTVEYALYCCHKESYTQDKLEILLHTFPFSKKFVYKLLDSTIEMERSDLTIVIEKFIEEQGYYENSASNRFEL